jgi:uncharacterized protein YydD (DUF2326 family)
MIKVTENWLHTVSGKHRETIRNHCVQIKRDKDGKMRSDLALQALYIGEDGGQLTHSEALRRLAIEKTLQVKVQTEILRKTRIPIDDVLEIDSRVFQAIAGTLKANLNKVLTIEKINEMFAEFRGATARKKSLSTDTPCPIPTEVNEAK